MRGVKILFLMAALALIACRKKPNFPNEPVIEFKSFTVVNDSAVFTLTFTDGDGNLGLKESDTLGFFHPDSTYYYNLFLEYYEQENGTFVKRNLAIPFYYRTPFIEPEGKDKWLQGEIAVTISPFYYDFISPLDSFKYSAQLVDREFNQSNVIETPIMVKPN